MFNGYNEASPIYSDCDHDRNKKHLNVGKWPQGHGTGLQPHLSNQPEYLKSFLKYPNVLPVSAKCSCAECYTCPDNQSLQGESARHRPWFPRAPAVHLNAPVETAKASDYHQWENVNLTDGKSYSLEETRFPQENGEKSSFHRPYAVPRIQEPRQTAKASETKDAGGPEILLLGQSKTRQAGHYGNGCYDPSESGKKETLEANGLSDFCERNDRFANSSYPSNQNALLHPVPSNATQNRVPSIGHRSDSFIDQNFHDPGKVSVFDETGSCRNAFQQADAKSMTDPRQDLQNGHAKHFYSDPKLGSYADYSGYNVKRDYLAQCYPVVDAESQKLQYYNKKNELLGRNPFPEAVKKTGYTEGKRDCMMSGNGSVHEQYYGAAKFWEANNPKISSCGIYYPKDGVSTEKRQRPDPKVVSNQEPFDCSQRNDASGKRDVSNPVLPRVPSFPSSYPADPNGLRYPDHPFYYQSNPAAYKNLRRPEYPYPRYNAQPRYDYPHGIPAIPNSSQYNLKPYQPPAAIDQYLPHVNNNFVYDSHYQQPGLHHKTVPQPFYDSSRTARTDVQIPQHYPSDFGADMLLSRKPNRIDPSKADLGRSAGNKISPLRLLRKKKVGPGNETEGGISERSAGIIPTADGAPATLDVRKFWATFTDEEEEANLQQTQMIVLNYQNIDADQAELLRLCEGQALHVDGTAVFTITETIPEKTGEQAQPRPRPSTETKTDCLENGIANVAVPEFEKPRQEPPSEKTETVTETEKVRSPLGMPVIVGPVQDFVEPLKATEIASESSKREMQCDKWTEKKFDFVKKAEESKAAEEERKKMFENRKIYQNIAFGNVTPRTEQSRDVSTENPTESKEENKEQEKEYKLPDDVPNESFSDDSSNCSRPVEDVPTPLELPTSEYRKNKFLDLSGADVDVALKDSCRIPRPNEKGNSEPPVEIPAPDVEKISEIAPPVDPKQDLSSVDTKPVEPEPVTQQDIEEILTKMSLICFDSSENENVAEKQKKPKKSPKKNKKVNNQENGSVSETAEPKVKFSIQKLQDLKMSFKILNDSNTRENIAPVENRSESVDEKEFASDKDEKTERETIDLRLKKSPVRNSIDPSEDGESENEKKAGRRWKKKKIRTKTPVLKIKRIPFPAEENETEENVLDLSTKESKSPPDFRVHEIVDSANLKLTLIRQTTASEKENVRDSKPRKKTSNSSARKKSKGKRLRDAQKIECAEPQIAEVDAFVDEDGKFDEEKTDILCDPLEYESSSALSSDVGERSFDLRIPEKNEIQIESKADVSDLDEKPEEEKESSEEKIIEEIEERILETAENSNEKQSECERVSAHDFKVPTMEGCEASFSFETHPKPNTLAIQEFEERRTVIRHSLEENFHPGEEIGKITEEVKYREKNSTSPVFVEEPIKSPKVANTTEDPEERNFDPPECLDFRKPIDQGREVADGTPALGDSERTTLEEELMISSDEEPDGDEILTGDRPQDVPDYNLIESQLVEIFRHSSDEEKPNEKAEFGTESESVVQDLRKISPDRPAECLEDPKSSFESNECDKKNFTDVDVETEVALLLLSDSEHETSNSIKEKYEKNAFPSEKPNPEVDEPNDDEQSKQIEFSVLDIVDFQNDDDEKGGNIGNRAERPRVTDEAEEIKENFEEETRIEEAESNASCQIDGKSTDGDFEAQEIHSARNREHEDVVGEEAIKGHCLDVTEDVIAVQSKSEEVFSEGFNILLCEKENVQVLNETDETESVLNRTEDVVASLIQNKSEYYSVVPTAKRMKKERSRSLSKDPVSTKRTAKASSLPPETKFATLKSDSDNSRRERKNPDVPISDIPLPNGDPPVENCFNFKEYFKRSKSEDEEKELSNVVEEGEVAEANAEAETEKGMEAEPESEPELEATAETEVEGEREREAEAEAEVEADKQNLERVSSPKTPMDESLTSPVNDGELSRSPSPSLSDISSRSAFSAFERFEHCRSPFVLSGFNMFRNPSPPCEEENFADRFDISKRSELLKHPRVDLIQRDVNLRNPSPPSLKFSSDSYCSIESKTDSDGFSISRNSDDVEPSKEKTPDAEESLNSPESYTRYVTSPEKVSRDIFDFVSPAKSPIRSAENSPILKKDSPIREEIAETPSPSRPNENDDDGADDDDVFEPEAPRDSAEKEPTEDENCDSKNTETIEIECYEESVCDALVAFEDTIFVAEELFECEETVTETKESEVLPVAVDEIEEEKVTDDKFHDVMQNCLENTKKFLNVSHLKLLSCSVDDLLEIDRSENVYAEPVSANVVSEEHISRDVLLASCDEAAKEELTLGEEVPASELSVDFVPSFGIDSSRDDLCPEILPVDNWPYLEEEVPSSPVKSKTDESVLSSPPLEDALSSENPVCLFDPLKNLPDSQNVIPSYLGEKQLFFRKRETDENRSSFAAEPNGLRRRSLVTEIRPVSNRSSARRRKTIDGITVDAARNEKEKDKEIDSDRKKESTETEKSRLGSERLDSDKVEGGAQKSRDASSKRETVKKDCDKKLCIFPDGSDKKTGFLSRKWQPKVVLSRISEKELRKKKRTNETKKNEKDESGSPKKKPRSESDGNRTRNEKVPSEKNEDKTILLKIDVEKLRLDKSVLTQKGSEKLPCVPNGFSKSDKRKRSHESDESSRLIKSDEKITEPSTDAQLENKRKKPRFRNLHSKKKTVVDSETDSDEQELSKTKFSSPKKDSERQEKSSGDGKAKEKGDVASKPEKIEKIVKELAERVKSSASPADSNLSIKSRRSKGGKDIISEPGDDKKTVSEADSSKNSGKKLPGKSENSQDAAVLKKAKTKQEPEGSKKEGSKKHKETKTISPREGEKKKSSVSSSKTEEDGQKKRKKTEEKEGTDSNNWVCQVCGFDDPTERSLHIQTHAFHCQSCHLAFKTESYFIDHLTKKHKDIKSQHHCLLCELSFDSEEEHRKHLDSREHKHLESVEKNTINTLLTLLTGQSCPILGPVENKPEWLPNRAGTVHFYHQATPLSLALQYLKMRHDSSSSRSRRPSDNHPPSIS